MGTLDGKVVFITGAARGQGRSHALRLAAEGANIIAVDLCAQVGVVAAPMSTPADLAETVRQVEALDRRIVAVQADVRDLAALKAAAATGIAELGAIDIVLANAGIAPQGSPAPDPEETFRTVIDINLVGVWNTIMATAPQMIERGAGGSIVITSSTQGLRGTGGDGAPASLGYTAAKHGLVGLMRSCANWLAPHSIRVNTVHPTGVNTPMIMNEVMSAQLAKNSGQAGKLANLMPVPYVESIDVSNAIAYLVADSGRYVTGVTLPVDAGFTAK
jgi:SDR family mycofactocin-dependent oxidoreductase